MFCHAAALRAACRARKGKQPAGGEARRLRCRSTAGGNRRPAGGGIAALAGNAGEEAGLRRFRADRDGQGQRGHHDRRHRRRRQASADPPVPEPPPVTRLDACPYPRGHFPSPGPDACPCGPRPARRISEPDNCNLGPARYKFQYLFPFPFITPAYGVMRPPFRRPGLPERPYAARGSRRRGSRARLRARDGGRTSPVASRRGFFGSSHASAQKRKRTAPQAALPSAPIIHQFSEGQAPWRDKTEKFSYALAAGAQASAQARASSRWSGLKSLASSISAAGGIIGAFAPSGQKVNSPARTCAPLA